MASVAAINGLGGHAHNPRGNLWFNDDSTYGHKLLMKMGWNKGKGLGKNENGIKENLKVKCRSTNSGLGFKDDAYANVMKTEYESILKNLAAEYSCPGTTNLNKDVNSFNEEPVQKSKIIKSKLRYPKLFFGKDVTKYSEKDMKGIFICSTPLKSIEGESKNPVISDKQNSESESAKAFDTFSSSLSISDYFAKKMEEKRSNALNKNLKDTTTIHQKASLDSEITDFPSLIVNDDLTAERKQKDSQVDIDKGVFEQLNQVVTEIKSEQSENVTLSNKKSSKKRKKKSEDSIEDTEKNSSENESNVTNISKENIIENSLYRDISDDAMMSAIKNTTNQNSRSNKKRKRCHAFENDLIESAENIFSDEIKSSLSPIKKKKKKSKIYSAIIQLSSENPLCKNENTQTDMCEETNNILPEPVEVGLSNHKELKKKKKSKKKLKEKLKSCLKSKHGSYSLKNISFNETVCYRIIDSDTESVEPLACCENLNENTASDKLTSSDENNSNEDAFSEEKITSITINSDDSCSKEQSNNSEKSDECTLSDLPSSKSSYYNAWVESQRQAIKMQLYKKMLKSIRNHKILKTTNLLSIKGYGNWGFK